MLQSELRAASIPPTPPPARLTPTHPPPHGHFRCFEKASYPPMPDFSSLNPKHILPPQCFHHTGDLSPTSKDRISLLWPIGMNGKPTTLEFQTLLQYTSIIIGISL
uniref:Uncharacterized protein n=1 Tax=Araneus ventricosus TaxID=182803 RepID=A0A4Y2PW49_ARAVE|nr:hypothetical protein AVEN_2329-1 [Araneus ventricosus]